MEIDLNFRCRHKQRLRFPDGSEKKAEEAEKEGRKDDDPLAPTKNAPVIAKSDFILGHSGLSVSR